MLRQQPFLFHIVYSADIGRILVNIDDLRCIDV